MTALCFYLVMTLTWMMSTMMVMMSMDVRRDAECGVCKGGLHADMDVSLTKD
jgi:uncharacterized membrane protein